MFKILCSHQFCPALLFYWCVAFWEAGNWLVFRASSLPQCVWSMQRPGHPPGQSRGKGVCQKHCPQQAEPSLGKALWCTTPPLPPMLETILDYWYLWNVQSSLLFHSSFHTRFLMLLWQKFWGTSIAFYRLFWRSFCGLHKKMSGGGVGGLTRHLWLCPSGWQRTVSELWSWSSHVHLGALMPGAFCQPS